MNRDRYGELVEDQAGPADIVLLPHDCDGGWLDRDTDHPRPCPTCKPDLAARVNDARQRQAERHRERTELQAARAHGLPHRHRNKLHHLAHTNHPSTPDHQP